MISVLAVRPTAIGEAILDVEVDSFCGDIAQGNRHRLLLLKSEATSTLTALETLSRQTDKVVIGLCLSDDIPRAFYFQRGHTIHRCGSGNLACAFVLDKLYDLKDGQQIMTQDGPVKLLASNDRYGYQTYNRLSYSEGASRALDGCFNRPPEQFIFCGGDTDYIICVYPQAEDLISLQADFQHIRMVTQRALIATAPAFQADGDYALRYFAPQWGNNEDPATGSANAIVGPYWGKRLGLTELHSYQASAAGGEFWIKLEKPEADCQVVSLFGRCRSDHHPVISSALSR